MNQPTDTELLDWLECSKGEAIHLDRKCMWFICWEIKGELVETNLFPTVREALDAAMNGFINEEI